MNVIAQILVDLSWGLTFGALIAAGTLAAKAAGAALGGLVALGLGWLWWRRRRRRS
jgi:nitrate reductase gamma subunit